MSAIGDYVHYTRKGYETHGITQKGGGGAGYEYGDVKRMITERMKEQISKNKIEIDSRTNSYRLWNKIIFLMKLKSLVTYIGLQ